MSTETFGAWDTDDDDLVDFQWGSIPLDRRPVHPYCPGLPVLAVTETSRVTHIRRRLVTWVSRGLYGLLCDGTLTVYP